jgi:molecular chaperone GrpE
MNEDSMKDDKLGRQGDYSLAASSETTGAVHVDGAPTEAEAALNSELQQLRGELDEAKDRILRAQADLENYRKRIRKEMDDERRYAELPLLRDLLPVVDNVGRAIAAAEKKGEASSIVDGFKLVAQQLETVFAQHHCQKIEALHHPFDPHLHAAISQQPSSEFPPNTVTLVAQDGYQLHERVIRPSQVIVSTAAEK